MPKENKLQRILLKQKHRNPLVEVVMRKGVQRHNDKRYRIKHKKKELTFD